MRKDRLLKLAEVLDQVPNENFRMEWWLTDLRGRKPSFKNLERPNGENTPVTCGTAACALGWACFIPEFKEAGLKFTGERDYQPRPSFEGYQWEKAGREFFDLTQGQAFDLFMNGFEMTAKEKAAQIREMVAEDGE